MIPPTSIDGTDITGATIDGTDVTEITVDGDTVFTAVQPLPDQANIIANYDALALSGLSDGQVVNTWTDESGNGRDMSADDSTEPRYETNEINGNPAVEGQSDYFADGNFLPNAFTYYCVYKQSGGSIKAFAATYKNFSSAVEGWQASFDGNGDILFNYGDGSNNPGGTNSFPGAQDGNPHIFATVVDANNGRVLNRIDNTELDNTGLLTLTIDHGNLYLMTQENAKSRSFDGFQGQNLFYGTVHNQSTRDDVVSSLANKWGISL